MKFLYTDIDSVLSLGSEMTAHSTPWGLLNKFNKKAVKIYNEILKETGAIPIISSDWKHHFTLEQFKQMWEQWAGIIVAPLDFTPHIPGATIHTLENFRSKEIKQHAAEFKPESWVAIDDLDLSYWISKEHFVHLPRFMEGIKQTGKKTEIIRKLNNETI